jgi:hypothetical protein
MNHENQSPSIDDRIDNVLQVLGSAEPRPGLEKRIAARLAHTPSHRPVRFFGLPRVAFATAAGAVASVAIIAGSVTHSHRILPIAPGVQLTGSGSGIGAAAGARVASKPVAAPEHGRPRSMRKPGTELDPANGVAVPKRPLPQAQPGSQQK